MDTQELRELEMALCATSASTASVWSAEAAASVAPPILPDTASVAQLSLYDTLREFFAEEKMAGDESYQCQTCQGLRPATKVRCPSSPLHSLPSCMKVLST